MKKLSPGGVAKWIGTAFGALSLGTLFGVYQFIWNTHVEPTTRPPNLLLSSSIDEVGRKDSWIVLNVRSSIVNKSNRRLKILHSWFNMYGYRFPPSGHEEMSTEDYGLTMLSRVNVEAATEDTHSSRYKRDEVEVLYSGKMMETGAIFQINEDYATQLVFNVKESAHDVVRFRFDVTITTEEEYLCTEWATGGRGEVWADVADRVVWAFPSEGWPLIRQTRSCKEALTERAQLRAQEREVWEEYWRRENRRLFEHYKLGHTHSTVEYALMPRP
jgi:hypothetical protein